LRWFLQILEMPLVRNGMSMLKQKSWPSAGKAKTKKSD